MRIGPSIILIAAASFALRLSIAKWGVAAFWTWSIAIVVVGIIIAVGVAVTLIRLKLIKRRFCGDRIRYAKKNRQAFGQQAFNDSEIIEMERLHHRGDYVKLGEYIASLNALQLKAVESNGTELPFPSNARTVDH